MPQENAPSSTSPPIPASQATAPPAPEIRIHTASTLLARPSLANRIIALINKGYLDTSAYPSSTDASQRFRDGAHLHSALGDNGLVAVAYHVSSQSEIESKTPYDEESGEPVACACASQWTGDLGGENSGKEDGGYEIKAVTSAPAHRKAGLVNACLGALIEELVGREKRRRIEEEHVGGGVRGRGSLKVWVHAVEEYNGPYWRRKGWSDVRAYELPAGHMISPNSVTGFRLLVLLKEVEVGEWREGEVGR
ncbi:hypothetical protein DM02DRAFT_675236 [Periconia macrospinosa]|uniref:N-acetyltransferase domain-containing protein n=1 Tax=Periconia macrospinosa TaxID=97972 RepID=A0A2V1DDT5_9PLEO|nr:hypothetical protein DM02DRAFT_675236 [Periconia macrospinosa]